MSKESVILSTLLRATVQSMENEVRILTVLGVICGRLGMPEEIDGITKSLKATQATADSITQRILELEGTRGRGN